MSDVIGFNHIGRLGQLGNQMFQYSALKGIARNRGFDYVVPNHREKIDDGLGNKYGTVLFDVFDIKANIGVIETQNYVQEPHFEFSEQLFNECPSNVSLWGFFQTDRYFRHIREDLLNDFAFKPDVVEESQPILEQFNDPVALHIRRGDFLINHANHNNLTLDYYAEGLKHFDDDREVVIFSDDTDWCKEQELFSDDRFLVSEGNSSQHDLYLMSRCRDFIIANSSFSWWGAWLADYNKVIAPAKWFGPNNADKNTSDLFCSDWITIGD